jgi:hypothetical protein
MRRVLVLIGVAAVALLAAQSVSADNPFSENSCTFTALTPQQVWHPTNRGAKGRASIHCIAPTQVTYKVCTQLLWAGIVQEVKCQPLSGYQTSWVAAGQTITITAPELTTSDSCPEWAFKSRVQTSSNSGTSDKIC